MEAMPSPQEELAKVYRANESYLALGIKIVVSFFFFVVGGYWLDSALGTSPLFLIVGATCALMSVMAILWKLARPQNSPSSNKPSEERR